jgi:hypothetical protein
MLGPTAWCAFSTLVGDVGWKGAGAEGEGGIERVRGSDGGGKEEGRETDTEWGKKERGLEERQRGRRGVGERKRDKESARARGSAREYTEKRRHRKEGEDEETPCG